MVRSDHILGGLAAAAGVFLLAASFFIPVSPFITTLSAQFFPRALAIALMALGAYLVLHPRGQSAGEALAPVAGLRFVALAGVVALYFLTFAHVDFRLGTAIFLFLAMLLMGSRHPAELVLVPIGGALVMWAIFRFGFTILLPTWI